LNGSILWQDNSSNTTFTVTMPGEYWVQQTDNCGIIGDSIQVNYSTVNFGNDMALCEGTSFRLEPNIQTNGIYLWQDSSSGPTYTITEEGIYWVRHEDYCGTKTDTI